MSKGKWKNKTCQEVLIQCMKKLPPMRAKKLAEEIGFSYQNVRKALLILAEMKVVRRAGWEYSDGHHLSPLFALGSEPDAPKPDLAPKTIKAQLRAQLEVLSDKDDILFEIAMEKERARKIAEAKNWPIFRHPMDIALFGEYRRAA